MHPKPYKCYRVDVHSVYDKANSLEEFIKGLVDYTYDYLSKVKDLHIYTHESYPCLFLRLKVDFADATMTYCGILRLYNDNIYTDQNKIKDIKDLKMSIYNLASDIYNQLQILSDDCIYFKWTLIDFHVRFYYKAH